MEIEPPPHVVCIPSDPLILAGLPAVLRTIDGLVARQVVGPVFLAGGPRGFARRWHRMLHRLRCRLVPRCGVSSADGGSSAALLLANDGYPDVEALARFCEDARGRPGFSVWTWRGRPICVYKPANQPFIDGWSEGAEQTGAMLLGAGASVVRAPDEAWIPAGTRAEIRRAEKRLAAGTSRDSDGFLSRFDRRISEAISLRLVRTPVTPNQVTWASIVCGLAGAALMASPGTGISLAGVFLVWGSAILDGCDGEVARLKRLSSEGGARLDLFGDHVVNMSVLVAVALHVYRLDPQASTVVAGALLALGVALSSLAVWWFLLRPGRSVPSAGKASAIFERVASRDFVYLLIPLAAFRRLDWFLYASALGSNLFWIALCVSRWLPLVVLSVGRWLPESTRAPTPAPRPDASAKS